MISAGEIAISIQRFAGSKAADSYCRARVSSTRPPNLYQVFAGKPVQQMLETVPLLFSICRGAQSVAAVRAAEQALAIAANPQVEQQRDCLVSLEMLHEHLWKLLVDLPPLLGLPARLHDMAVVSQALQQPLQQLRQHACRPDPAAGLATAVGLDAITNTGLQSLLFGDQLVSASSRKLLLQIKGFAGDLLRAADDLDFLCDSSISSTLQPRTDPQALAKLLASAPDQADPDDLPANSANTHQPSESGSLVRMHGHPWVRAFAGRVLCGRLAALLAETHELLQGAVFPGPPALMAGAQQGCAEVATARGRLTFALAVTGQKTQSPAVSGIQVIAPTDWHFHPQGIATYLLNKLPADHEHLLSQRAELLIKLVNPCVSYRLDIQAGGVAEASSQQGLSSAAELAQVADSAGSEDYA